jgi:hypothetical protein
VCWAFIADPAGAVSVLFPIIQREAGRERRILKKDLEEIFVRCLSGRLSSYFVVA